MRINQIKNLKLLVDSLELEACHNKCVHKEDKVSYEFPMQFVGRHGLSDIHFVRLAPNHTVLWIEVGQSLCWEFDILCIMGLNGSGGVLYCQ